MKTCPKCHGKLIKYGFLKKEKTQRYRCKTCRKLCSDAHNRVYGTLRSHPEKINLVITLLTEGVGIRSASRIANIHRDTVLRILKHAGKRSYDLLTRKLVDVPVNHVQADETWTYVLKKSEPDTNPESDKNPWGDFYVFLGLESQTKLLLMPAIGKRSEANTEWFANDLSKSTTGRFQLTTDGFRPYRWHMKQALGDRIDFAQFYKELNMFKNAKNGIPRNAQSIKSKSLYVVQSGSPDTKRITTAHVERVNLTLRIFNKRFNRKTICFSKDEEYLAYSVYLFVAHYNFCRHHSALGKRTTPAMANKLTDSPWNIAQLIANNSM